MADQTPYRNRFVATRRRLDVVQTRGGQMESLLAALTMIVGSCVGFCSGATALLNVINPPNEDEAQDNAQAAD